MAKPSEKPKIWEDKWFNTVCSGCYCACGIRVRRINGVVAKVEGVPGTTLGAAGGICAKGAASLMTIYDPNRLNVPLRRTNPEKGIGVDPKWKEITWDEALDEMTERMKKIKADNPQKLWFHGTTSQCPQNLGYLIPWLKMFGSDCDSWGGGALHCGNAAHFIAGLVHAAWSVAPDWRYTNYVLQWGASKGTAAGHSMTANARLGAEARARGIKLVCVDPICNFAGGKATEWVPILPGTDGAVALAMANIIMNKLGMIDVPYLKKKTNLPFLVGPDGRFVRDKKTDKPLLWDASARAAKLFDDPSIGIDDYALEGSYEVEGVRCQPAFMLLREHLKKHTAEWASQVSTVPVDKIRRLAREFAENARIGSTITIKGKSYPFRPVSSVMFRGGQGHSNGVHQVAAISLLSCLVGADDVPGGTLGWPAVKRAFPGGHWDMKPKVGTEGVIIPGLFYAHEPWPLSLPKSPINSGGCEEFWTMSTTPAIYYASDREDIWQKLGMPNKPEMLIVVGCNFIVGHANWEDQVEIAKKIPFIVQFDLWSNETAEAVADMLLPDQSWAERLAWCANLDSYFFNYSPSLEDWWYHCQVPVIDKPIAQRRHVMEVIAELTNRVGFRPEWNNFWNNYFGIKDEELRFKPEEKPSWEEMGDRILKWMFGREHGLDYFMKGGTLNWEKLPEEVYWRWEIDSKVPVYMEYMLRLGEKTKEIGQKVGLEMEYEQFTALPTHFPTVSHREMDSQYDMMAFSYRDVLHTNSTTQQNPWMDEASRLGPYTYTITMNADTAKKKGIKDGDVICLETPHKRKTKGIVKLMEGQHPQTVGIAGQAGLWAKGRPIARGKGSNFDVLLQSDLKHFDPVTLNIETAAAVKVYKVTEA